MKISVISKIFQFQHLKSFPSSRPIVCHAEKETLAAILFMAQLSNRPGIIYWFCLYVLETMLNFKNSSPHLPCCPSRGNRVDCGRKETRPECDLRSRTSSSLPMQWQFAGGGQRGWIFKNFIMILKLFKFLSKSILKLTITHLWKFLRSIDCPIFMFFFFFKTFSFYF